MMGKYDAEDQRILTWLSDTTRPGGEWCSGFKPMVRDLGYDRAFIRRRVRLFTRRNWAEYHKPLWTDSGEPLGAGYCITLKGRIHLAGLIYKEHEK